MAVVVIGSPMRSLIDLGAEDHDQPPPTVSRMVAAAGAGLVASLVLQWADLHATYSSDDWRRFYTGFALHRTPVAVPLRTPMVGVSAARTQPECSRVPRIWALTSQNSGELTERRVVPARLDPRTAKPGRHRGVLHLQPRIRDRPR
jgi:hypothetical protein